MRVRICIAVNDADGYAAAHGWDVGSGEERGDRWSEMRHTAQQLLDSSGGEPTRFLFAEADIPEPGAVLDMRIIESHRARQCEDFES